MSAIKIHLEMAEIDAVERYAKSLNVKTEDVAYAALNRLMRMLHRADANDKASAADAPATVCEALSGGAPEDCDAVMYNTLAESLLTPKQ